MSVTAGPELDPFDPRLARVASGRVRTFNEAGVLRAADVHVARRLSELAGEADEVVCLAVALAVRAPRLGHVHVDLASIRGTASVESDEAADLGALDWPDPGEWVERVQASGLVAVGEPDAAEAPEADRVRPLRLLGTRLYLDRYWAEERQLAADLLGMAADAPFAADPAWLGPQLDHLFGPDDERQREAADTTLRRRLSVVAGGPGTGKTTTVARVVALLLGDAVQRGVRPPVIALAAPTGKAAARLGEAIHEAARALDIDERVRAHMLALEAFTLHRLLRRRPDSDSRFRHDRRERLPHDVVIVDETSMVSLSLMTRLVEAIRPHARLVLVGDPGQLASIEAGAVLGDIVGPAAQPEAAAEPGGVAGAIVVLDRVHRFGGGIARLAEAVRRGDADGVIAALERGGDVEWLPVDVGAEASLEPVRRVATEAGRTIIEAARVGNPHAALHALGGFRLLCAHRRGPYGVATWSERVEGWLAAAVEGFDPSAGWYPGRPLLVVENDYELGLLNGDTGVVVAEPGDTPTAVFERREEIAAFSPARLGAVETLFAMTIHKSQGSQFGTAAVILPSADSRILTRELLYTAVTRAQRKLIVAGTEEVIRTAVARPIARASGLRDRLWLSSRA